MNAYYCIGRNTDISLSEFMNCGRCEPDKCKTNAKFLYNFEMYKM
jgi:hypothetical protein